MGDYIQFSAKTKNEAITKACIELGVSSDQLDIQVVSEGSSGFFGIGSKPAVIQVRKLQQVSEDDEIKELVEAVKVEAIKEPVRKEAPKRPQQPKKEEAAKEEKAVKEVKPAKEVKEFKKEAKKEVKKENKEAKKENKEAVKEEKAVKEKQPKPQKERQPKPQKEKQPKQPKEKIEAPKEKAVKEKAVKEKPAKPVEILTDAAEIKEIEQRAVVFLRDVFASMNLGEVEITSKYNTTDGSLEVDFEGEDMGLLIGKRGQTLDSLQYLTSLVVNKGKSNYIRVKLDTEDYRRRRKETLENLARGIAYKVKKTRKPVVLEPMNPYERRIIHSALQGNKFVETISEGEEPYRHVVVKMKKY